MGLDDFMDSEVAIAVAAAAALFSPQVRGIVRRGVVFGLSGLLAVGGALSSVTGDVAHEVRERRTAPADGLEDITAPNKADKPASRQVSGARS